MSSSEHFEIVSFPIQYRRNMAITNERPVHIIEVLINLPYEQVRTSAETGAEKIISKWNLQGYGDTKAGDQT